MVVDCWLLNVGWSVGCWNLAGLRRAEWKIFLLWIETQHQLNTSRLDSSQLEAQGRLDSGSSSSFILDSSSPFTPLSMTHLKAWQFIYCSVGPVFYRERIFYYTKNRQRFMNETTVCVFAFRYGPVLLFY